MPRRRQLADVADGISGHFLTPESWRGDWAIGDIALTVDRSTHRDFVFDLLDGTVSPFDRNLEARAVLLRTDLLRHLSIRRVPRTWVTRASLSVVVEEAVEQIHALRCQVMITDDLGAVRTSTRRSSMDAAHDLEPLWVKGTLMARLRARMTRRSEVEGVQPRRLGAFSAAQHEAVREAFALAGYAGTLRTLPSKNDHERVFILKDELLGDEHSLEIVLSQLLYRRVLISHDVGTPTVAFD